MLHGEIRRDTKLIATWSADIVLEGNPHNRWHVTLNLSELGVNVKTDLLLDRDTDDFLVVYHIFSNLYSHIKRALERAGLA